MSEHTKGARNSTWDKHTDRDKGRKQEKIQQISKAGVKPPFNSQ